MVIRSGEVRKKLVSREKTAINNGDIIELIPGNHLFKYVSASTGEKKRNFSEANSNEQSPKLSGKKIRNQGPKNEEISAEKLKVFIKFEPFLLFFFFKSFIFYCFYLIGRGQRQ